ncbi:MULTISPECIES: M20 family metallopeptidase [unclassified Clostridium]|uniref:M20 metallopeptidase family protein n=1 Tax=Clostridium TaxID=1485 RepID=UPI001C8C6546|nr:MULTISPECIES: M20 family metallopeptidase [unclassified Clostridium]MBX9138515.1 amidohydrolase [Clostridium sp. K12(2020)]MBX9145260.1 amidohydrolase [Clostridium sp. K13]MDU2288829.1 M20 family metallopeptidase [Clostridium celatum]MDU4325057.1 M20 family metallopeptidase [Clostridium celatum]
MKNFNIEANNIKEELIEVRRTLHQYPELGFEETNTSKFIKEFLTKEGIEFKEFAGTGVCGIIKGTKEGINNKVIGLRADIDGLPMQDKKSCSYASKINGKMHACGHDGHTTILLGAAKLLNKNKDKFNGTVKLIFEPAEETTGGAKVMISEGVLKDPAVDVMCGLHVEEVLDAGMIMVKRGTVNAASNPFTITIKGSGGHGAYPDTAVDPIVIASHVVTSLQSIVSREIKPVNPAVVTIGSIHGGTAQNIIPSEVKLGGIIRTMTNEDREFAKRRLKEIVNGICTTFRGSAEIEIEESYPCLYNDDNMVEILEASAKNIIGSENVKVQKNPKLGVESFAYFANEVPSVFYFLGIRNEEKGIIHSAHNSLFDIDEDALPIGVAIQCEVAINYLTT